MSLSFVFLDATDVAIEAEVLAGVCSVVGLGTDHIPPDHG